MVALESMTYDVGWKKLDDRHAEDLPLWANDAVGTDYCFVLLDTELVYSSSDTNRVLCSVVVE